MGYDFEEHVIVAADNYELTLHRILPKINIRGRKPILMMHQIDGSSYEFVANAGNSPAILLAK
jgi:hypothetical protein